MDHDRAFIEAIQEHPDDDVHRLVWADWLDDHGQADRATFVRHQVRLERLDEADPARDALEDEADDLLAAHEDEWAGRAGLLALDWRWRGGVIERVTVGADTFLEEGEALFRAMPIREVRLLVQPADLPKLADCPWLRHVERLELGQPREDTPFGSAYLRDAPLLALLASPYLTRLSELELTNQGVEGPAIQALIEGGFLRRLRALELTGNKAIGDRMARLLAGASGRLERLSLANTNITPHGLRALLTATGYPELRTLDVNFGMLFRQGISPAALERELLQTPLMGQLTSLCLYGVGLEGDSLAALLRSPVAPRLETLRLTNCALGEAEAQVLADAESLAGLRHLQLSGNLLRDKGCRALASGAWGSLTQLDLSNTQLASPGLRALLASPALTGLTRLDLSSNYIGAAGATALAGAEPRRLTWLHLGLTNLRAEGARALAESNSLARLRVLWLNSNNLDDEGVAALAGSPNLPHLRELHLDGNVESAGAQALIEAPQLARVRQLSLRSSYITHHERERLSARYGPATQF